MPFRKQTHLTAIFKNSISESHLAETFLVNKFISSHYLLQQNQLEQTLVNYKKVDKLNSECDIIQPQVNINVKNIKYNFKVSIMKIRNIVKKQKLFYNILEQYYWFNKFIYNPLKLKKVKSLKLKKVKSLKLKKFNKFTLKQLISKKQNYIKDKSLNLQNRTTNICFVHTKISYLNSMYQKFKIITKLKIK